MQKTLALQAKPACRRIKAARAAPAVPLDDSGPHLTSVPNHGTKKQHYAQIGLLKRSKMTKLRKGVDKQKKACYHVTVDRTSTNNRKAGNNMQKIILELSAILIFSSLMIIASHIIVFQIKERPFGGISHVLHARVGKF